jgi:hypothetical protein
MAVRIEYDITLDDIADAHLRAAARSKLARRTRWYSTFWTAAITGALIFLWLLLRGATLAERVVFAGLGVTIGAGGHWLNYRRSMKRRILKYLRERMQSDGPLRFVMELRDDCIWTKQDGTQSSFEWSNVAEILDSEDGIELRMRDGGFVIVRSRGFPSQEARQEFKEIANKRMERDSGRAAVGGGPTGAVHP